MKNWIADNRELAVPILAYLFILAGLLAVK